MEIEYFLLHFELNCQSSEKKCKCKLEAGLLETKLCCSLYILSYLIESEDLEEIKSLFIEEKIEIFVNSTTSWLLLSCLAGKGAEIVLW